MFILDKIPGLTKFGLPHELWLIIEELAKLPRPNIKSKGDYISPALFHNNILGENYFKGLWFQPDEVPKGYLIKYYNTVQTTYKDGNVTASLKSFVISLFGDTITYTITTENLPVYFMAEIGDDEIQGIEMIAIETERDVHSSLIMFSRENNNSCNVTFDKGPKTAESLYVLWEGICFGAFETSGFIFRSGFRNDRASAANSVLNMIYRSCEAKNPSDYEALGISFR